MSFEESVEELNKISGDYLSVYKELSYSWSPRKIDNIMNSYSGVRKHFLKLVKNGGAQNFLDKKYEGLLVNDEECSNLISLIKNLESERIDYCEPSHVYAVMEIARQAAEGVLRRFLFMDKDGEQDYGNNSLFWDFCKDLGRELSYKRMSECRKNNTVVIDKVKDLEEKIKEYL